MINLSNIKISNKIRKLLFTSGLVLMSTVPINRFAKEMYNNYQEESICKDIENGLEVDPISEIIYDGDKDLVNAKEVTVRLIDNNDYSFLNEMTNLEKLTILDYRVLPIYEIDGSVFTKDMDITIINNNITSAFSYDKYAFLKDIPCINNLYISSGTQYNASDISGLNIESAFLESLYNVHNLKLDINNMVLYNYTDLTHLDSLELNGEPYNVAMIFSNDDLSKLKDNGVNVTTNDMETLIRINNEIDEIVDSLNIDHNASDREKVDIILSYILKKFSYDQEVSEKDENDIVDYDKFYYNGSLYGALESDTQICGNYAAMFTAMAHKLGLTNNMLSSNKHAWNIVLIDGKYYYIDSTILDSKAICYDYPIRYMAYKGNVVTVLPNEEAPGQLIGLDNCIAVMSVSYAIDNGLQDKINLLGYMDIPEEDHAHKPCAVPVDAVIYNNELSNIQLEKLFGKDVKKLNFLANYVFNGAGIVLFIFLCSFLSYYHSEIMEISKVKEKEFE